MIKITKQDLSEIRELARRYYLDDANHGQLEAELFNVQCLVKAVTTVLKLTEELEFPTRKMVMSFDDENG